MTSERIHFVTGRLAEHALRKEVAALAHEVGFKFTIEVLPITVAALMTPAWIARRVQIRRKQSASSFPVTAKVTCRR